MVGRGAGLSPGFLGIVAILQPIVARSVIASQSDALPSASAVCVSVDDTL